MGEFELGWMDDWPVKGSRGEVNCSRPFMAMKEFRSRFKLWDGSYIVWGRVIVNENLNTFYVIPSP